MQFDVDKVRIQTEMLKLNEIFQILIVRWSFELFCLFLFLQTGGSEGYVAVVSKLF